MFAKRARLAVVAAAIGLSATAALSDPFADGLAAFDRGDFSAAHRLLMPLAEQGDPRAAIAVAGDFYVGWGVPANDVKAEEWRLRAKSIASPADFDLVISRWRSKALSGDAAAQAMLGAACSAGFGVPMDPQEALKWIRAAADQGHARGQYALGEVYLAGDGVAKDVPEATKWLSLAADQGDASAQLKLAVLAGKGLVPGHDGAGAPSDDNQDPERYRRAAAGGNPLAQVRLGELYLRGNGVTQDAAEAYQWLVLASTGPARLPPEQQRDLQGLLGWAEALLTDPQERAALHALAGKCRDGTGVPQDEVLADRLTDMAESRGRARPATAQAGAARLTAAPAVPARGDDCLFVIVRPSLRDAVRVAAGEGPPRWVIRFDGDPGAERCEWRVELTFSLRVDRTRQSENWRDTEGAPAGAVALGSVLPWPCPTTHTLLAVVRNRAGEQLDAVEASALEQRTGTMLRCTDESGPSDAIATELVRGVLRRMTETTTPPVGAGGP